MITGRNVVVGSILLLIVSLAINAYTLLQPLDNDGKGRDSYGVLPSGHRAIYEVLREVDVPSERSHAPFEESMDPESTLVLIGPDVGLLGPEKGALQEMKQWVGEGGRLVVGFVDGWPSYNFLETFSLNETRFIDIEAGEELYSFDDFGDSDAGANLRKFISDTRRSEEEGHTFEDDFSEIIQKKLPEFTEYPVAEKTGIFQTLGESVKKVAVPKGRGIAIQAGSTKPDSVLNVRAEGDARTVLAEYKHGKGSVILVADPALFQNLSLRQADNNVLAVQVLSSDRTSVVFDEFYHGLAIRGNPLWVFAQPGYRILILLLLMTVGLYIWHAMPTFGIIHAPQSDHRRSLQIYLDSVSRLLVRTHQHQTQLLIEGEKSFLWKMAKHLDLPGERNPREAIRKRLERRDPETLREFDAVLAEFQSYRQSGCSSKELLLLLKRSHRCLS